MAAVVVDYEAGDLLARCVRSILDEGVERLVVVENGEPGSSRSALASAGIPVPVLASGRNLGYGAGANRGIAATSSSSSTPASSSPPGSAPGAAHPRPDDLVLVSNPDLWLHPGAIDHLVDALDDHPEWAIVGPRIVDSNGEVYPSVRRFPSMTDAAGHALLALAWPDNPFSRRYRPPDSGGGSRREVDWVSGACFLARRTALDELGGFDEGYFMFAEDIDLCWRAHEAGWGVGVEPAAVVTHVEGVSRGRHPYRMLAAHHRSALRFEARRSRGAEVLALPAAAAVLGVRLACAAAGQAVRARRSAPTS